ELKMQSHQDENLRLQQDAEFKLQQESELRTQQEAQMRSKHEDRIRAEREQEINAQQAAHKQMMKQAEALMKKSGEALKGKSVEQELEDMAKVDESTREVISELDAVFGVSSEIKQVVDEQFSFAPPGTTEAEPRKEAETKEEQVDLKSKKKADEKEARSAKARDKLKERARRKQEKREQEAAVSSAPVEAVFQKPEQIEQVAESTVHHELIDQPRVEAVADISPDRPAQEEVFGQKDSPAVTVHGRGANLLLPPDGAQFNSREPELEPEPEKIEMLSSEQELVQDPFLELPAVQTFSHGHDHSHSTEQAQVDEVGKQFEMPSPTPPSYPFPKEIRSPSGQPLVLEGSTIPFCPHCMIQLEAGARFCGECGFAMEARIPACPGCALPVEPAAKFCGECGWALEQAQ
ncbi:MAG: zinc ribbon domain-containing protein, partial [Candidatus Obscuribacterales bacterium]|nr:zinc ribbon domain-containing protein [Candidatus Obscuribacterales bacterium]